VNDYGVSGDVRVTGQETCAYGKTQAGNIGFAKVWQDVVTSATAISFGLGLTSSKILFSNFINTFLFGIAAGQTSFKFQTFAKPERWGVILKDHSK
jgi:hypothetical protein